MAEPAPPQTSFTRIGPALPATPVVIAVPHAGREYPPALHALAAVPLEQLEALEDRHADLLAGQAAAEGTIVFVARRARAWIDLNRDEREVDPAIVHPRPRERDVLLTAKVRGGLGLIPRRVPGAGELWRRPIAADDLARRIAGDHRPWHGAIAAALAAARARFGAAVLIDCHSMPSLPCIGGVAGASIVLGDLHGRSAAPALVDGLADIVAAAGFSVARNRPYAGGYTLDRHGAPALGIHALQIEVDRALYLAPGLQAPGDGVARVAALVARMADAAGALIGARGGWPEVPLAAE